jgi:hypothetical protein
MHRRALIAAICMSLLVQTAVCQEAFQVTNVTIKMIKREGRGNFRIIRTISRFSMCVSPAKSETGGAKN